jgi:hypothetical protein
LNRQEAAMAAITIDAFSKAQVWQQIRAVNSSFRSMLNASVSNRMLEVAAEVGYPRQRQTSRSKSTSVSTVTTVQLTIPLFPHKRPTGRSAASSERKYKHLHVPPTDRGETPSVKFEALDPNIVSDAIPAFFIGRNGDGSWVARDATGRIGGLFLLKSSALSFAREQSWPSGCAMIFPSERFELDLENKGNQFAPHLEPLMRRATNFWLKIERLLGISPCADRVIFAL